MVKGVALDHKTSASSVVIEATANGVPLWTVGNGPTLTIRQGAPPVTLIGIRLEGAVVVEGARLDVANVTFSAGFASVRRLHSAQALVTAPALSISGGHVTVRHAVFEGYSTSAAIISAGILELEDSVLKGNAAVRGGGMRVYGGHVTARRCLFEGNQAAESGGAIEVEGGTVLLADRTLLLDNQAPLGRSLHLLPEGSLSYALPSPLARWIIVPDVSSSGRTSVLLPGGVEADFPFPCSAG